MKRLVSWLMGDDFIQKFFIVLRCPSRHMLGQNVTLEKVVSFHGFTIYS